MCVCGHRQRQSVTARQRRTLCVCVCVCLCVLCPSIHTLLLSDNYKSVLYMSESVSILFVLLVTFQVQIKTYSICSSLSHFKRTETVFNSLPSPDCSHESLSIQQQHIRTSRLTDCPQEYSYGWTKLPGVLTFGLAHTSFPLLRIQ